MSLDNKPEWFQIADADNAASTRKISKSLPIMAILAFAAIIGVGTVVAQTPDEAPANASEIVTPAINSNQSSASLETTLPTTQVLPANKSAASVATVANSAVATAVPSTPGIANPLEKKPSGGEHEDEEEDDYEGEDD
jgi:hypothetical protein